MRQAKFGSDNDGVIITIDNDIIDIYWYTEEFGSNSQSITLERFKKELGL